MMVNLTPHTVIIIKSDGSILSLEPAPRAARCAQQEQVIDSIDGIPVSRVQMGAVENLPARQQGVTYIVSHIVLQACPERSDLVKPGELVRNEQGEVIGCKCLSVL